MATTVFAITLTAHGSSYHSAGKPEQTHEDGIYKTDEAFIVLYEGVNIR